ncbi:MULTISPECIES: hypothetical protein [Flavobacterium]|uniref:hypothetical protein n=1 Tax=Flavobacterium TaxID=237 RepID=UPI003918F198
MNTIVTKQKMIVGKVNSIIISLCHTPYLVIAIVTTLGKVFYKRQQLLSVYIDT